MCVKRTTYTKQREYNIKKDICLKIFISYMNNYKSVNIRLKF